MWTRAGTKVSWEMVPYVQLDFQCFTASQLLKWNMSRCGIVRGSRGVACIWKAGVILRIPNLLSHLPPRPFVSRTSDGRSCSAFPELVSHASQISRVWKWTFWRLFFFFVLFFWHNVSWLCPSITFVGLEACAQTVKCAFALFNT